MLSWIESLLGFGLPAVLIGAFLFRMLRGGARNRRLQRDGIRSDATIVSMEKTGVAVNDEPEIKFTLEIEIAGNIVTSIATRIGDAIGPTPVHPGDTVTVRYDRTDPTVCVIIAPDNEADEPTGVDSQTGAEFDAPLWLFGTKSSEAWLLPRNPERRRVVVVDVSDPFEKTGEKTRDWVVDSAAFLLTEMLWMRTDVPSTSAVVVSVPLKKIISPHGGMPAYEDLSGLTQSYKEPTVVAWGVALKDIDKDGITLKVRMSNETQERSFTAPLAELADTLVDWLVGRGLCARVDPPAWYAPVKPEHLPLWAVVHHNLQIQTLADRKNGVLAPLDEDFMDGMIDYALDGIKEFEGAGEQVKIAAITSAVYAHRAGVLRAERKKQVLDVIASLQNEDVKRLIPRFYYALGERERAEALPRDATSAYRSTPTAAAYRDWLTKIDQV